MGQYNAKSDELTYRPIKKEKPEQVIRKKDQEELEPKGFFVVKCLGKNKILVDGQRVEQDQVALLQHASRFQMNSLCLYFLLPTNSKDKTMEIPAPLGTKRKAPSSSTNKTEVKKKKKPSTAATKAASFAAELEALSVETLLSRMTEAVESDQWDRKHQLIGSAISLHAVRDAARSKSIRELDQQGKGVARSDIMAWIKENPKYTEWVSQMLGKMELKSLQSNVSKALVKAGYVRTGTTGRHVKWILPKMDPSEEDEESRKEEESSKGEEESAKEEGSDDDEKSGGDDGARSEVEANNSEHSSGEESDSGDDGQGLDKEKAPEETDKNHENDSGSSGDSSSDGNT